jgi:hypothetical protein
MVQLRHPQVSGVQVDSRERRDTHTSPNRIVEPCDGCRWPDRCRHDLLCWAAEKRDIATEGQHRDRVNRVASSRKGGTPI